MNNLFIEIFRVSHERHDRNQDVYSTVVGGWLHRVDRADFFFVVQGGSYPHGGNYCVYDGVCTHLVSHAQFLWLH